jgi:hypothetical protein
MRKFNGGGGLEEVSMMALIFDKVLCNERRNKRGTWLM